MASQAEVDLVISTAGALPELERDLSRIITTAENRAPDVDVAVGLDTTLSLRQLDRELTQVLNRVEGSADQIEVDALLNQRESIRQLTRQIDQVVNAVDSGNAVDPLTLQAVLDGPETLRTVRTQLNRVVSTLERTLDPIELDVDVDRNRIRSALSGLRDIASRAGDAASSLGRLGLSAGTLGVSLGAILPILAGVAAAAQQVAPAAAVATSGMLAMGLAAGTLKLAMVGVSEAIETAFDPDAKPEDLEKALKKLAPEARKFVVELRGMRTGLRNVQQEVQNRFFKDFDTTLRSLSRSVLPPLRRGLNDTADVLNEMALGAAGAAKELADNGTLGTAVNGATKGLENLKQVPAQIVTALGQLAAASAPALDKLTRAIDVKATEMSERLTKVFESKELEGAIDEAISTIGQLFTSLGLILKGIGNIFGGLTQEGRGLFDILEEIARAFEELTASQEFQLILGELAKTADTLVKNILPLLQEAFVQLAPVIEELAPIVREFIDEIGPELIPVIQELGPVLLDIVKIMKEQLPLAIGLAKNAIALVTLILQGLHFVLEKIILPAARKVKEFFQSDMVTGFNDTATAIGRFAKKFVTDFTFAKEVLAAAVRPMVQRLLDFQQALRNLGQAIGRTVGEAINKFIGFRDGVARAFINLPGALRQAGLNAILGFIGGFQSGIGRLLGIARSVANSITSTIKDALSIASPSRVMADIGEDTVAGLVVGLKRMTPQVEDAMSGIAGLVSPSFALPDGQTLSLPQPTTGDTQVQVFIGNEQFTGYIRTEINTSNRARDRVLSQGGGRR